MGPPRPKISLLASALRTWTWDPWHYVPSLRIPPPGTHMQFHRCIPLCPDCPARSPHRLSPTFPAGHAGARSLPHTAMNSCGCLRCDRGRGRAHHNNELQMVWSLRRACGHTGAEDRNAIFHFSCFSFLVTAKISSYTPLYLTIKVLVCANGLGTNDGTGTPFSVVPVFPAELSTIEISEFILLYFTLQLGTMKFSVWFGRGRCPLSPARLATTNNQFVIVEFWPLCNFRFQGLTI